MRSWTLTLPMTLLLMPGHFVSFLLPTVCCVLLLLLFGRAARQHEQAIEELVSMRLMPLHDVSIQASSVDQMATRFTTLDPTVKRLMRPLILSALVCLRTIMTKCTSDHVGLRVLQLRGCRARLTGV